MLYYWVVHNGATESFEVDFHCLFHDSIFNSFNFKKADYLILRFVHRIIYIVLGVLLGTTVFFVLKQAGDYYTMPLIHRPHHALHKLWKPGGYVGHGFGTIGSFMLIILFSYSLRKRIQLFRKWGKLPIWLNYHIFLGIAGPILITFHTAFKFGGLISISYWSMMAVAFSGFIGRYIYTKIPRHVNGKNLSLQEFEHRQQDLNELLASDYGFKPDDLQLIEELASVEKIRRRGMLALFTLFGMDVFSRITNRRIISAIIKIDNLPKEKIRSLRYYLRKRIKITRQIAFWSSAHRLFHYWHVIHKPFAYTMIVIMVIHSILVISFGYRWIF